MKPTSKLLILTAIAVGAYVAVKKGALQVVRIVILETRDEIKRRTQK